MSEIEEAYQYCQSIASQHYENFPVASRFLPKKLRQPIAVIYAFARTADDYADEHADEHADEYTDNAVKGVILSPDQRLNLLGKYRQQLKFIEGTSTQPEQPIFIALADVIDNFNLPISLFYQLLQAFEQDVKMSSPEHCLNNHCLNKHTLKRPFLKAYYQSKDELVDYCTNSANPIGRLLLYLHKQNCNQNNYLSDQICTALQLINFLQDMQQDIQETNRLYIPAKEIDSFNIKFPDLIEHIKSGQHYTENEKLLLAQQIEYAEKLLQSGQDLINQLTGRFKLEIALIVHSGLKIIEKLKQNKKFSDRPRLNNSDKFFILLLTLKTMLKSMLKSML